MDTVTLVSPRAFVLNCDIGEHAGKQFKVNKGNTENFPADLVDHWYVKAHGAKALAEATSGADNTKTEGGEDKQPPAPPAKPAKAAKAAAAAPWQQK